VLLQLQTLHAVACQLVRRKNEALEAAVITLAWRCVCVAVLRADGFILVVSRSLLLLLLPPRRPGSLICRCVSCASVTHLSAESNTFLADVTTLLQCQLLATRAILTACGCLGRRKINELRTCCQLRARRLLLVLYDRVPGATCHVAADARNI